MTGPHLPRFGEASLADLLPSALAAVTRGSGVLPVPDGDGVCVLLVDGLGVEALESLPVGSALAGMQRLTDLDVGFPATTATSLATLGTGRPAGEHGIVGYAVAVPDRSGLHQHLRWDGGVVPEEWQPLPTVFEQAEAVGVSVTRVSKAVFAGSGLTRAALRGGRYVGADDADRRRAGVLAALRQRPALVYAYLSDLDYAGHAYGPQTPAWRSALAQIDAEVAALVAALPPRTGLLVTGDHGMVAIAERDRIDLDADPAWLADVDLLGGEPRARHLYTRPGAAPAVADRWRGKLGDRAWVRTRAEAVAEGWFGPTVTAAAAERIGDVVVAPTGTWALVSPRREPKESLLPGMHGSLTPAEQRVPLLWAGR